MTGISQLLFNKQENGNMITVNGKEADTKSDKGGKIAYKGVRSGSQNLAASNKALQDRVKNSTWSKKRRYSNRLTNKLRLRA